MSGKISGKQIAEIGVELSATAAKVELDLEGKEILISASRAAAARLIEIGMALHRTNVAPIVSLGPDPEVTA